MLLYQNPLLKHRDTLPLNTQLLPPHMTGLRQKTRERCETLWHEHYSIHKAMLLRPCCSYALVVRKPQEHKIACTITGIGPERV
jgi:hypothetical protein